jgi:hypothetical protein
MAKGGEEEEFWLPHFLSRAVAMFHQIKPLSPSLSLICYLEEIYTPRDSAAAPSWLETRGQHGVPGLSAAHYAAQLSRRQQQSDGCDEEP